jgi:hypothetical protein
MGTTREKMLAWTYLGLLGTGLLSLVMWTLIRHPVETLQVLLASAALVGALALILGIVWAIEVLRD